MLNQLTETCRILEFARRWYRFGGGPAEDILVDFGVNEQVYFHRVIGALEQIPSNTDIDDATRLAIRAVALQRLRNASHPISDRRG